MILLTSRLIILSSALAIGLLSMVTAQVHGMPDQWSAVLAVVVAGSLYAKLDNFITNL